MGSMTTIDSSTPRQSNKTFSIEAKDEKGQKPPLPGDEKTTTPHDNDVLCGRGGSINSHPGNEQFRQFVERKKRIYLTARFKREKRLIASSIVEEIRELDPPGRFLTKDASGGWVDIGDEKARDKVSQALRENAPTIRRDIETENEKKRAEMRIHEAEEKEEEGDSRRATTVHHHQQQASSVPYWGYQRSQYDRQSVHAYDGAHGGECSYHHHHHQHPTSYGYREPDPRHIMPPPPPRHPNEEFEHAAVYEGAPQPASHGRKSAFEIPKLTVPSVSQFAEYAKSSFSFGGDAVSTQSGALSSDNRHGDIHHRRAEPHSSARMKSTIYPPQHAEQHQPQTSCQSRSNKRRSVHFQAPSDGESQGGSNSHDGMSPIRYRSDGSYWSRSPKPHNHYGRSNKYRRRYSSNQEMYSEHDSKVHQGAFSPAPSTPHRRSSSIRHHLNQNEEISTEERWQQGAPPPASHANLGGRARRRRSSQENHDHVGASMVDVSPMHYQPRHSHQNHDGQEEESYKDHAHELHREHMSKIQEQHSYHENESQSVPHRQVPRRASESSLLSQVAQHILSSFDNISVGTSVGTNNKEESAKSQSQKHPEMEVLSAPSVHSNPSAIRSETSHPNFEGYQIEEEGQEVELVEEMECEREYDDGNFVQNPYDAAAAPMPSGSDDTRDTSLPNSNRVEVDWSSKVGGCHTFLQETLSAASFFKNPSRSNSAGTLSPGQFLSPANSMDMDVGGSLCGTEIHSCAGSVGGNSLCNVFEGDNSMIGNGSASLPVLTNGSTSSAAERMRGTAAGSAVTRTSISSGRSWSMRSRSPSPFNPDEALVPKPAMNKAQGDDTSISLNYSQDPTVSVNSDANGVDDFIWSWDGKGRE